MKVDPEPVQPAAGLRLRKARAARERQETAFELGLGEGERAAVERSAHDREAGSRAADRVEGGSERLGIRQVTPVGFVDRALELALREARGEVDERARGARHRDAVAPCDVARVQRNSAVRHDAGMTPAGAERNRHFDLRA